jgi:mono/diheme cytochrome c family protein
LYEEHCAVCHEPDVERGRPAKAPSITAPGALIGLNETALFDIIREGRPGTRMPAFDRMFESEAEIRAVMAYLRAVTMESAP